MTYEGISLRTLQDAGQQEASTENREAYVADCARRSRRFEACRPELVQRSLAFCFALRRVAGTAGGVVESTLMRSSGASPLKKTQSLLLRRFLLAPGRATE